jgi:hypothetical protein
VQVVRDGRDVVASMLADPVVMAWYRPSFVNVDTEFPNPFFGIESVEDREAWPRLSPAGRCALRWRWSVRLAARLHHGLPSGQLKTIRYEHLMSRPDEALADLSRFAGTTVQAAEIRNEARTCRARGRNRRSPGYENSLSTENITEIEKIAGEELRRLGYALLSRPASRTAGVGVPPGRRPSRRRGPPRRTLPRRPIRCPARPRARPGPPRRRTGRPQRQRRGARL